jgi:hypothetical protein
MDKYKKTLEKILDAIGYTDDKESFINKFISILQLKAVDILIKQLDAEKQNEILKAVNNKAGELKTLDQILLNYFPKIEIEEAIKMSTYEVTLKYIDSIKDTLSKSQREAVVKIFDEM